MEEADCRFARHVLEASIEELGLKTKDGRPILELCVDPKSLSAFSAMPSTQARAVDDFVSLFRYTRWANDRMLGAMQGAEDVPARAVELFSHLLRAQDVWFGRVQGTDHAELLLWVEEDLSACAERAESSAGRWQRALKDLTAGDLDQSVAYTNSKGEPFETPLRAILTHVVNHGTHHRAQIALVLRNADIAPPPTDYIFYLRERDE